MRLRIGTRSESITIVERSNLSAMATQQLSLGAELLLLSIDPASGGLLVRRRHRRRRRRAVRADAGSYRAAVGELRRAGLAAGGGPFRPLVLADRQTAASRLRALEAAIRDNELSNQRDTDLLVLLAWTGVLAKRLPAQLRRLTARRLRQLGKAYADAEAASPRAPRALGSAEIPAIFLALGIVDLRHTVNAFDGMFEGSAGGDFGAYAGSDGASGGGDGGGGGGGGGGDGGGGGGGGD